MSPCGGGVKATALIPVDANGKLEQGSLDTSRHAISPSGRGFTHLEQRCDPACCQRPGQPATPPAFRGPKQRRFDTVTFCSTGSLTTPSARAQGSGTGLSLFFAVSNTGPTPDGITHIKMRTCDGQTKVPTRLAKRSGESSGSNRARPPSPSAHTDSSSPGSRHAPRRSSARWMPCRLLREPDRRLGIKSRCRIGGLLSFFFYKHISDEKAVNEYVRHRNAIRSHLRSRLPCDLTMFSITASHDGSTRSDVSSGPMKR
jgi:hypothetical protein